MTMRPRPLAATVLIAVAARGVAHAAEGGVVSAVVYPDRAQVTRTRVAECAQRAPVVFAGIPPAADPTSFRAAAQAGAVQGLRFEERLRALTYGPELKDLEARIRRIEGELGALRDARARNDGASGLADRYGELALALIGREMSEPRPNVGAWSAALNNALSARLKASRETSATDGKLRELEATHSDLRRREAALGAAGQRKEYVAEVIVSCTGRVRVELTYLVGGAHWAPAYEARLGDGGAVDLSTFGTITQTTGEDWKDARITLSTAVPRQNATPPDIAPLKVWADERKPPRKALVSRSELQRHAEQPVNVGAAGGARLAVADQGVSVTMTITEPADVAGDGSPARLLVARTRLPGQVHYRSAPKFMPFVFRVADVTNAAPFPLLPGPLDAFRKGDFLGRYGLERVATGERFTLTFGVEESMKVKRTIVEEVQRDKGLTGGMRHHRYEYKLEAGNTLPRAEEVELTEQVPVSELDDVRVVIDGRTTGGFVQKKDDGLVTWRLKLGAGEKRELRLVFRIEAPASYEQ